MNHKICVILKISVVTNIQCMKPLFVLMFTRINYNNSCNLKPVRETWDQFVKAETGRETWDRFVKLETGSWNSRPVRETWDRFLKFETDS